jgi:low temperature requirement protein LtrA
VDERHLFVYGHLPVTGGLWAVGVGLEESEHDILDGIAWSVAERA